jgi:mannose-1-phosphate guanylyltransferase
MIEETICRIKDLIRRENIYIATNKKHDKKIKECIKALNIPLENVLFEPAGKNTLAPIAALTNLIFNIEPGAVITVLPCDHFIKSPGKFLKLLKKGIAVAAQGRIVTLGIRPHRPETGYGYIKVNSKLNIKNSKVYAVEKFIEKPGLDLARKLIKDKKYYWNNGIFIFKPQVLLEDIRRFMPKTYTLLANMKTKADVYKLWPKFPCISFDYAIMQKTKNSVLSPADYGWMDLGSWQAIEEVMGKDRDGNIFRGRCIDLGSKNTLVWSDKRLVATLGLKNIIIVDTSDALLVCLKEKAQEVKKIVEILRKRNIREHI